MSVNMSNVLRAPKWLIERMNRLAKIKPRSEEEVRIQFEASRRVRDEQSFELLKDTWPDRPKQ